VAFRQTRTANRNQVSSTPMPAGHLDRHARDRLPLQPAAATVRRVMRQVAVVAAEFLACRALRAGSGP
jgi:hypothetical protein